MSMFLVYAPKVWVLFAAPVQKSGLHMRWSVWKQVTEMTGDERWVARKVKYWLLSWAASSRHGLGQFSLDAAPKRACTAVCVFCGQTESKSNRGAQRLSAFAAGRPSTIGRSGERRPPPGSVERCARLFIVRKAWRHPTARRVFNIAF